MLISFQILCSMGMLDLRTDALHVEDRHRHAT